MSTALTMLAPGNEAITTLQNSQHRHRTSQRRREIFSNQHQWCGSGIIVHTVPDPDLSIYSGSDPVTPELKLPKARFFYGSTGVYLANEGM
jgi:hypothetical protein